MSIKVTKTIKVFIENKTRTIDLSAEVFGKSKNRNASIDAIVRGVNFNLCNIHHGYIKSMVEFNPRLRAKKSIEKKLGNILKDLENYILDNKDAFLLEKKTVKAKPFSRSEYMLLDEAVPIFVRKCNFRSSQSGETISWYVHDVYREDLEEFTVTVVRGESGQLKFFADEKDLYDQGKLRELVESEKFKSREYPFFFYQEALRLVGKSHGELKEMSGLFA